MYRLKKKYEPCLVVGTDPVIFVANEANGKAIALTNEIAEMMLRNGHGEHIFEKPHVVAEHNNTPIDVGLDMHMIYYNEETKNKVPKDFIGYDNNGKETLFFENTPIASIIGNTNEEGYIGIVSPRFYEKVAFDLGHKRISQIIFSQRKDVISFHSNPPRGRGNSVIVLANHYHNGYLEAMKIICSKIGLQYHENSNRCHIYSNHFVAKKTVYKEYVNKVLLPAMEVMNDKTITRLQEILFTDTGYKATDKGAIKNIQHKFGLNYYPMHTFLCERLPTLWLDSNHYSTFNI